MFLTDKFMGYSVERILQFQSFVFKKCAGKLPAALWRRGFVVSIFGLIIEVNQRWARLVFGCVTVFGRVNHLGMQPANYVDSAFHPFGVGKTRTSFGKGMVHTVHR